MDNGASYERYVGRWSRIVVGSAGWAGFFWVLRNTSASLANTFAYVSPVVAVILGWAILSEAITPQIIIATTIIMTGVVLIVNKGKTSKKEPGGF